MRSTNSLAVPANPPIMHPKQTIPATTPLTYRGASLVCQSCGAATAATAYAMKHPLLTAAFFVVPLVFDAIRDRDTTITGEMELASQVNITTPHLLLAGMAATPIVPISGTAVTAIPKVQSGMRVVRIRRTVLHMKQIWNAPKWKTDEHDPVEGEIIQNATVTLSNGRIQKITKDDTPEASNDNSDDDAPANEPKQTINLKGRYLYPGLMDAHVHVTAASGETGLKNTYRAKTPSMNNYHTTYAVRETLARRFTSVRDCGGADASLKTAIHEWLILGPRIEYYGQGTVANGFDTYVTAHAYSNRAMRYAVENGVMGIEHGNFLDDETAAYLASKGVLFTPTLTTSHTLMKSPFDKWIMEDLMRKNVAVMESGLRSLEVAESAGLTICFGSDLMASMQSFQNNKFSIRAQVQDNLTVLRSVTANPAGMMSMEGDRPLVTRIIF
ncbi:hypothetical protein BDW69DRAFT_189313 [Aspergillus filifer]